MMQPVLVEAAQSGSVRKVPPTACPTGVSTAPPTRMAEMSWLRIGLSVDLGGDEAGEDAGALVVADEDDAAAGIVGGEVVFPGGLDVGVGQLAVGGDILAAAEGVEGGERHLPVGGRVEAAGGAEAGELLAHDLALFRAERGVGVGRGVLRDGGVDVEAIDRRVGGGREEFGLQCSIGGDDGDGGVLRAGIVAAGAAEPVIHVRIVERRGRGDGGMRRGGFVYRLGWGGRFLAARAK